MNKNSKNLKQNPQLKTKTKNQKPFSSASISTPRSTMARKFFVGGNWKCVSPIIFHTLLDILLFILLIFCWSWMQNGTSEEVKKIVSTLNNSQVPSSDVVGKCMLLTLALVYANRINKNTWGILNHDLFGYWYDLLLQRLL
jgi:hypothetical protein